mgnify:CR=1 FL=1
MILATHSNIAVNTTEISTLNQEYPSLLGAVAPPVFLSNGLVAFYPFNGNAQDESGNVNNGVAHGAKLTTDRFAKPNMTCKFNGVNDHIDKDVR